MKTQIEHYLGFACFFENTSYNCPKFNLFGFSTERQLHSAIRREVKKPKNKWILPERGIGYMQGRGAA